MVSLRQTHTQLLVNKLLSVPSLVAISPISARASYARKNKTLIIQRSARSSKRKVPKAPSCLSQRGDDPPPSLIDKGKAFVIKSLRDGARRPIEQAEALQKIQQERPQLVNAVFIILAILAATFVAKDLLKAGL
jgi:hypothetical protein